MAAETVLSYIEYVSQVLSSGRYSLNVLGTITKDCLGPLVRLPRFFNSAASCQVIDHVLIPNALNADFKEGNYMSKARGPSRTLEAVQRLLGQRGGRLLE